MNEAPVLPGETLADKYKVERVLGQGGMGIVVAARHLELDERVAIKFLVGERSSGAVDRFLREARAAVKVKGEHVCRVFDFGRLETGEPYIVMEHLEGTDLARKLEREGPQPPALVVGWVVEACDALAEAHSLGIIHRDLKPANVFLAARPDGSTCAKVLDFGISKLPKADAMTSTSTMMGSPAYMSPEQMESARDVDARSDVWSLGVMLYELVAGTPPFVGESVVQLAVKVREAIPEAIEARRPDVPEGLSRVIGRCLEKRPEDRYASVAELAGDLAPFAPPHVSALVTRLVRRVGTPSRSALALVATAHEERNEPRIGSHEPGTFAPVESKADDGRTRPTTRRWPSALAAIGIVGLVVVVAKSLTAGVTLTVPPEAAIATTAIPSATGSLPSPSLPGVPSASVSAAASSTPPREMAAVPERPAKRVPTVPAKPRASIDTPPAAPSATITSLPTTHDPRKKRELDREDP